jgi:FkbM family methyltransferase
MQERQDRQLLLSLLCPGMTALDIGANVGTYALPFATRVGKTGHVHAFEPSPSVASRLRTNVEISGLNNVSVQEVAVSDNARGAQLHFAEDDDRNSLAGASHRSIMVSTTTLDDYLAAHGINGVDVMKIDVEGAEALVLRGACKLLSSESAPVIMIEINPAALRENGSCADEVIDLLARYGYTAYQMSVYDEGTYANVLAMQPRHTHRYSALHHRPDRVFEPRQLKDPGN